MRKPLLRCGGLPVRAAPARSALYEFSVNIRVRAGMLRRLERVLPV